MSKVILIAYYSRTGHTRFMAEEIGQGIRSTGVDAEVKVIAECCNASEFLSTDGILLGTLTYASNIAWPVKKLMDELLYRIYRDSSIAEKVLSGFTSSGTLLDAQRCLQAFDWAFEHTEATVVPGLVILDGEPEGEISRKCREFGRRVAEEVMKGASRRDRKGSARRKRPGGGDDPLVTSREAPVEVGDHFEGAGRWH